MRKLPNVRSMSVDEAYTALEDVQAVLWGDAMENGIDPDEIEWGSETLDEVARCLHLRGIGPKEGGK